jgi:hypothetical protein
MKKLSTREFEICTENGINIVICTVPLCDKCKQCINEDWMLITQKYPFVKIYEYDISMDFDKCELYDIVYTPTILIFKNGSLYDNFSYTNIDDVLKRINIQKIDLEMYPNY